MDNNDPTLLASSGDYHQLICYQKAVIVYDLTYWFCERYMERSKDRTVDQMMQAARSGKQNIVEGITDGADRTKRNSVVFSWERKILQLLHFNQGGSTQYCHFVGTEISTVSPSCFLG